MQVCPGSSPTGVTAVQDVWKRRLTNTLVFKFQKASGVFEAMCIHDFAQHLFLNYERNTFEQTRPFHCTLLHFRLCD
jgi:hypothetical protein